MTIAACSTQKNTAKSRWWHAFNARYNTYYNGAQAYIEGSLEKEQGNRDNFTEMIPLYTVGNKNSRELGKSNFDRAIEKCQKAIKLHSIKRKPVWTKKRRKTEKDLEWLGRKEYNPFLWKAWLLMGRSQFNKGDFDEAASTFSYMSRLYQTQPAIYGKARAWLAKCYLEEGWIYDAEDVIRNMQRDSIHWQARKEWDYTYASYYIHTGDYAKAIPYLRKVIKHEMRSKQRAREWYLMGQLHSALGNKAEAMKAYKRVIRQNPPYEVEFNAHIAMTEVMSGSQSKKMIKRLRRMASSDKNKDYLDQVYYAIGNIYLTQKDTLNAIIAYEKGNSGSTRNGIEKGVLLLKLGGLYWERERYSDAQRCYGEAIGLLDKERKDYEELSRRSKVLDELVPYTDAVHLQDSLQALAKMGEKERNEAIDRVIEELKKKEKEEQDRLAEQNAQNVIAQNGGNAGNTGNANRQNQRPGNKSSVWYFYNQMAVNQGKAEFQKIWGKRENVDNWQRVNKTVVAFDTPQEMTEEQLDSIARAEALADSLEQVADSAQNDPHKREYYLKQIPFTEEQVQASNLIIMDGLYNSGVIFKDKLDNLPLSEKALRRITDSYPEYENMADVFYHLFLLYSRMGDPQTAETYVEKLRQSYPESPWTTLLTDPYFAENAKFGEHIEDSIYAATYDAFKADRLQEVAANLKISETRFPLGANRDKFIFIGGLGKLNNGDAEGCVTDMNTLVEKFPQSELSNLAGMIVNGVKAGRRIYGGKFDMSNVWERRTETMAPADSTAEKTLSNERNTDFLFIFAYSPDSVDENRLLYELAKYNFTSYMVRNFDIVIEPMEGINRMTVSGFRNYDEALQYARQLYGQQNIIRQAAHSRTIIISKTNLPLLGTKYSYDDYDKFYNKHFAPLKVSTLHLLTEPTEITTVRRKDNGMTPEEIDRLLDNGTFIDNGLDVEPAETGTIVAPEETAPEKDDGGTVIPAEGTNDEGDAQGGTTIVPEPETPVQPEKKPETVDKGVTVSPAENKQKEDRKDEAVRQEHTVSPAPGKTEDVKKDVVTEPDDSIIIPLEELKDDSTQKEKPKEEPKQPLKKENEGGKTTPKKQQEENSGQEKKQPAEQLEEEFYFDDTPQDTGNKRKKDVPDVTDDEYYDLEGF
ncbi:tetratricopeptide repeat protein [Prevotella lascolaii]|uniref:Tetratricopeptide repeat protein n=1 Tax=Leyella lascolaii TaxID=1776379 RepID=A0AAW7JTP9_9BACT|nr:tetratricopeptide repeat protein [Leyella lascolaii]MDN0023126.1 tetratricopeptide repeat protein [Leyella lascolaii]MDN0025201.1 tetratricopeptide repeat protein [Leyella lascolaii]